METKFINIHNEPVKKNREFARELCKSDIPGSWYKFNKIRAAGKEYDSSMTLDSFVENAESPEVKFVIGLYERKMRSEPFETIGLIMKTKDSSDTERMFEWYCPLTERRYAKVDNLFRKIYGMSMDEYGKKG
jgi:hypothetical protein